MARPKRGCDIELARFLPPNWRPLPRAESFLAPSFNGVASRALTHGHTNNDPAVRHESPQSPPVAANRIPYMLPWYTARSPGCSLQARGPPACATVCGTRAQSHALEFCSRTLAFDWCMPERLGARPVQDEAVIISIATPNSRDSDSMTNQHPRL